MAVVIPKRLGEGGAHIEKGVGKPDLLTILESVADDLAALKPSALAAATIGADIAAFTAATVGDNIAAFTDPPSAAEMALLRTFVNALKADHAATLLELATLRTFVNALKADVADIRTKFAAKAAITIGTTKASGV